MRHWWFGLFALLQEMWLACGSLVLALSPFSSCKCKGCDGIWAKSHCKNWHKGCAQDNTEDRGEAGHRVQLFVSGSLYPHSRTRNYLKPFKPMRGPRRSKALKWWPSIHTHALHYSWDVRSLMTQLQLTSILKLAGELHNTLPLSFSRCLLPCKMPTT